MPVDGNMAGMPILQICVSNCEPLGAIFEALRYEYSVNLGNHHTLQVVSEGWRYMAVNPGDGSKMLAKCFTSERLPHELPWGWVATGIFPAYYEVSTWIDPIPHGDSPKSARGVS